MEVKLFEVRDRATFIPAIGIRVEGENYLTRRAGYGKPLVLFGYLSGGGFTYDPSYWSNRTMGNAHRYIADNWSELNPYGEVIDVEFILGETTTPKPSESLSNE